MSWAAELREAFNALRAGGRPRVGFDGRADTLGEVGREFNALAAELEQVHPNGLTREEAHRLRNRLAGIVAAVQVLRDAGELGPEKQAALSQVLADARALDVRLRPR